MASPLPLILLGSLGLLLAGKKKKVSTAEPPAEEPKVEPAPSAGIRVAEDGSSYDIGVQWRYLELEPWLQSLWQEAQDSFGIEVKMGNYDHGFGARWSTEFPVVDLDPSLIFDPTESKYLAIKKDALEAFSAHQGDRLLALRHLESPAAGQIKTQVYSWMDIWLKSKLAEMNAD